MNQARRHIFTDLLVLAILWIVAAAIVNPQGNFPLNDDWVYGWSVKSFLDSGTIDILNWSGVSLICHVLWGIMFAGLFGFSFDILRISILLLGLVGVLTTYLILGLAGSGRRTALIAALVVAFNPLYFELSFTFMTDISFLAFVLLTLLFLFKYLADERLTWLVAATITATISTLIRDVGVLLPAMFAIVLLMHHGLSRRSVPRALIPLAVSLVAYVLYRWIVAATVGTPSIYDAKIRAILNLLGSGAGGLIVIFDRLQQCLLYLGLFLAPFLVAKFAGTWRSFDRPKKRLWLITALSSAVVFTWRMAALGKMMPLAKNVLFDFGLGPPTLRDVGLLHMHNYYRAPEWLWLGVTFIATLSTGVALGFVAVEAYEWIRKQKWKRNEGDTPQKALVGGVIIGYIGLLALSGLFDRYLIVVIPFCLLAIHYWSMNSEQRIGRIAGAVSAVLLIMFALFAIGATHDYLSWNRARWTALDHLTTELHVSPERIDGGVEFNGWFQYDEDYVRQKGKSWWWVKDDEYIVSFGPMPGYQVEGSYPYTKFMPSGESAILILRRENTDTLSIRTNSSVGATR